MLSLTERLRLALFEDLAQRGDVTSQALVPADKIAQATLLAKADGVLCGVELLSQIFTLAEEIVCGPRAKKTVRVKILKKDGAHIAKCDEVATIRGNARALLAGERVALNLVCHLSGIATQTAQYVAAVAHTHAKILDTRKTTPLWRDLEKYAVICGGGENHRHGLHDMILIKDNHLALWGARDPAGAVNVARAKFPNLPIEIEVVNLAGLESVCRHSAPDFVLLDNFSLKNLRAAVNWRKKNCAPKKKSKHPTLEASGGVTLETLTAIAETGVERISIGALTHSACALDLSLELKI
ncbi:MAG: carboxylating nicotinate-nucleotide diphosphorylase [Planctomycetota bacterium]